MTARKSVKQLIPRSSLGNAAAKKMRARTPDHIRRRVVEASTRRAAASSGSPKKLR